MISPPRASYPLVVFVLSAVLAWLSPVGPGGRAQAAAPESRPRHILLRSSWQAVNIGDIGHTPGVVRLLERHFPTAQVTLWPMDNDPKVHAMLRAAFPRLGFVRGAIDAQGRPSTPELTGAFAGCDFLLHGSGPSVVARRDLEAWAAVTGKPYGLYGVTIDPVSALEGKTTEGGTLAALGADIARLPAAHLDAGLRAVLAGARFVFCRDSLTASYLHAQSVAGPRIEFAPDGAFGLELRDDALAHAYLRTSGLQPGKFICVIPRLWYTPYHLIRKLPPTLRDTDRAAISARHVQDDMAKVRELIVRWVRETGLKVLVCPEMTYQIDTGREFVVNRLPDDVKPFVMLRDTFWLPDEACSVYARAQAVVSLDNHSPIFALAAGTPALYVRQPTDTIKGQMWNDVGLGDWFCEIGAVTGAELADKVLAIQRDPALARARVAQIMRLVREKQAGSMAVVRAEATDPGDSAPTGASTFESLGRTPVQELLARVVREPALAVSRSELIAEAKKDAAKPVLRRPHNLQELAAWRVPLKYEARPPHMSELADREWEIFSLSQGDNKAGDLLKTELPRLAAAATLTADAELTGRALGQLEELATWAPLERRGWSLRNTNPRFSGDDGAWLGTGWLVRAIVDTVELLPPEKIPASLRGALNQRLAAELAAMKEDWESRRPPYVRGQVAFSNQWILPNEAMVRACLHLGVEHHRPAYELGIANLTRSMDAQGAAGEFVEGLRYADLSLESLYAIARATARAGDERLRAHPFLRGFPTWLVHHYQPGGFLINAFDSPGSARGNLARDQGLLATAALVSGNPHALWALHTRAGFGHTLDAIFAAQLPADLVNTPTLSADYPKATRLNWRSSWEDETATGLWLRGGHAADSHDHMDRGHVNFIIGSRALLIEAGTLTYAVPNFPTHMRSVAGHNVLQVGAEPPERLTPAVLERAGQILTTSHRAAPITVERIDEGGGVATVDLSRCYSSVVKWSRCVAWDHRSVTIEDQVELKQPDIVQFRWHLGVPTKAPNTIDTGRIRVAEILVTYSGDEPLAAHLEPMPDATLAAGKITEHACVVVRTKAPVQRLKLRTVIALDDEVTVRSR